MAEKRKLKKKGQEVPVQMDNQPTKVEFAVAKYLKNNVPTKKTKFLNHQVSYFNANKAIDVLLDSPWATGENALFTDRASVVEFGNKLLQNRFFHRARKIAVTDKDLSPKELKKKKQDKGKEKEKKKEVKKKEECKKKEESEESKKEEEKGNEEKEKKKKKTKIKLDMHLDQVFVDGSEAYVWMYDPIPFWYYIAGACLLFTAVAVCLFPLWPPIVRKGVYYLSIAAAGFLGVIIGLAILRFLIFILIWMLSLGRHHLWILPNLTEDVGFFASFWPLFHYEYKGDLASSSEKRRKAKKKKAADSEGDADKKANSDDAIDSPSAGDTDKPDTDAERLNSDGQGTGTEETDSENSNSQAFEILNKEDLSSDDVTRE